MLPAIPATARYGLVSAAHEDVSDDDVHTVRLIRSRHHTDADGDAGRAASTVVACREGRADAEGRGRLSWVEGSAPRRTRTADAALRTRSLYPTEL